MEQHNDTSDTDDLERFRRFLKWEQEHGRNRPPEATLGALWDAWYQVVQDRPRGPNIRTHRRYALELEFTCDGRTLRLGDLKPSECTPLVLEAWRAQLRVTKNVRGGALAPDYRDQIRLSLQACFVYHLDTGTMSGRNPLKGLPRERGWKGRVRMGYPTREFLDAFTPHCRPILADMIWLSFEAGGMRRDEMRLLRKAEYDPATKSLALQADRNKNEEPRVIILNERAAGIVERWSAVSRSEYVFSNPGSSAGGPVPESTLWGWLDAGRKAAAEAGVNVVLAGDAFCIHHARHGFTMRMQGVMPEAWVADQLGHSSTEMIAKRYGRLRGGEAREQARAMLEGRSQPVAPVESR